ncbi:hypothetical protein EB796_019242 [Bugula neritina]|uniref:Uncharacterized protein n=1 Tax=Bugula neritina TaxID=10212 RepID=A0A7J7J8Y3_BUGNE|nr:hypothetical protein EB796_019242 [Bugula neritina]
MKGRVENSEISQYGAASDVPKLKKSISNSKHSELHSPKDELEVPLLKEIPRITRQLNAVLKPLPKTYLL